MPTSHSPEHAGTDSVDDPTYCQSRLCPRDIGAFRPRSGSSGLNVQGPLDSRGLAADRRLAAGVPLAGGDWIVESRAIDKLSRSVRRR